MSHGWCYLYLISSCILYRLWFLGWFSEGDVLFCSKVQPTTPLSLRICRFVCLYQCATVSRVHMHTCLCVLGSVSKCVLAACFVCRSCCDRWSAAHAQINRPTLIKSGSCLVSNSVLLSVPRSASISQLIP